MDYETGEGIPDKETGELPAPAKRNEETGEYEPFYRTEESQVEKCTGFKIPSELINRNIRKEVINTVDNPDIEARLVFTGMKPNSPIFLFVIPTIIMFVPGLLIVLLLAEMILHSWAHKKNKMLAKDNINNIYYQSPCHVAVSEFCTICRLESNCDKIAKLHHKRMKRFFIKDYVKRVV